MRVLTDPSTALPEVQLLSTGRYHVMATHAGGGYSRWRDVTLNRWREAATCAAYGTFIYLRDRDSGYYWSSAYQPTRRRPAHYEAIFVQARAGGRRRGGGGEAHAEGAGAAGDEVE